MRRWSTTVVRSGLALLAGTTLLHSGPAWAQDAAPSGSLGGFEGTASASGLLARYNPEGILPISPPVDLSTPDALATIASGPATFARASILDPGDLLSNPGALLAQASPDYPEGAIPPYPFRISAASGSGAPTARLAPAPGLESSVSATETGSQADASTPRVTAPALVTVGSARSHAATRTDGSTVTVEASSSLSDLDLLGLLTIKSVSTELTVTSDGANTKTSGGTVVSGASILGQPVIIDADGIHPQKDARGVESALVTTINDVLTNLGLRVTVVSPIRQEAPQAGQVISAGLRIDLEFSETTYPQVGELLDQLPPLPPLVPGAPGLDDILAAARARHLLTVSVGQAEVNLGVRSDAPIGDEVSGGAAELPTDLPGASVGFDSGTLPGVASNPSRPIGTTSDDASPSPGFAEGIGVIAVLGLLLQPLLADRISRGAAILLADPTDACPREGT